MEKKFFQNYTLTTFEEAVAVASVYVNTLGNWNDMLFGNLFAEEKNVGKDNVDLSNCFLVTDEVFNTIVDVIDKYGTFEEVLKAYPDLNSYKILATLVNIGGKMVGNSSLKDAIAKDKDTFGEEVAYYDNCPFIASIKYMDMFRHANLNCFIKYVSSNSFN